MQKENPFQGDLNVIAGILKITGPLGTEAETFDGGTALEATYYHARYKGGMHIGAGGVLEFAYKGDYQYASGALTGAGELRINSGMPFYYAGNAGGFEGATIIAGGSIFHLNTAGNYGSPSARTKSFKVENGSALYVGGGGKIYTVNFAMEKNTTLVVNPGKFTIDADASLTFGEESGNKITLVFRVSNEDLDSESAPNPKLTVVNSGGVVLHPGTILRVDSFGYIPQPSQDGHFTLMDGLDLNKMESDYLDPLNPETTLVKAIFGEEELYIMNNRFAIYFINGKLMASQLECRGVPEPGTYGLFSGVFIAGLALLRRRRKKNAKT
jgi:hypothetical protein